MIRRTGWLALFVATFFLTACEPAGVDLPVTLSVRITPADGASSPLPSALYLIVEGPGVEDLAAAGELAGFTRPVSSTETRIAVLGPVDYGAVATFRAPDARRAGAYRVTLAQVAAADLTLLPPESYRVTIGVD